jgi:glycosyltransferase involved in cell wall biosynthesis
MVKVSVIIPAYNAEKFIKETINSVLNQDFQDFEIIVVNDASTDRTKDIVQKIVGKEDKVRFFSLPENKGRGGAVNKGIDNSRGEYIVFLDSDDLMVEKRLKSQVDFLDENKDVALVYGNMEELKEDGKINVKQGIEFGKDPKEILLEAKEKKGWENERPFKILDYKNEDRFIPVGSVMVRKKVFEKVSSDERLRNAEDFDLWLQIIGKGFKIKKMNIIGYRYREHLGQKSKNSDNMLIASKYISEKLKRGEYFK